MDFRYWLVLFKTMLSGWIVLIRLSALVLCVFRHLVFQISAISIVYYTIMWVYQTCASFSLGDPCIWSIFFMHSGGDVVNRHLF